MRPLIPLVAATGLFVLVVASVYWTFASAGGGSDASPEALALAPQQSVSGMMLLCQDGSEVQTAYSEMGDRFNVTGQLASTQRGGLLVRGPNGYLQIALDEGARVYGPYEAGHPVIVSGHKDGEDVLLAAEVRPACEGAFVAEAPEVSADTPTTTYSPIPVPQTAAPVTPPPEIPPSTPFFFYNDDDERDAEGEDDDHGRRGRGEGNGRGRDKDKDKEGD
jgi:hypothetical protein